MSEFGLSLDNLFKIIEIISIIGGGGLIAFRLGRASQSVEAATKSTKEAMAAQSQRTEDAMAAQGEQIKALQDEIKSLNRLTTEVALQSQRFDTQDRRLDNLDKRLAELAHGEGFVFPLTAHFPPTPRK